MGSESEEKKEMLIIDGNAFYEIDLECVKKKKEKEHREKQKTMCSDSAPEKENRQDQFPEYER